MYKGDLEGFPKEVVDKMLFYQRAQTLKEDVSILEKRRYAGKINGGFDWESTKEGHEFWAMIIDKKDFNLFFAEFPRDAWEEIVAEAKKRYAKGVQYKFISLTEKKSSPQVSNGKIIANKVSETIWIEEQTGCVYSKGNWAEILYTKEEPKGYCVQAKHSNVALEIIDKRFLDLLGRRVPGGDTSYFHYPQSETGMCSSSKILPGYKLILYSEFVDMLEASSSKPIIKDYSGSMQEDYGCMFAEPTPKQEPNSVYIPEAYIKLKTPKINKLRNFN